MRSSFLVKLQVPDRSFAIREENIPNLKSIFMKQQKKDEGSANVVQNGTTIESIIEILKEKLKSNLKTIPPIYKYGAGSQTHILS